MSNVEIARLLREIAASYTIKDENKFRFQIIAYQRASDAIDNTNFELKDLYKEGKLDIIPGIGTSIKGHLEELFETGRVKHFDWVKKDISKAVFPLLDIPGFGPKKAYKLVKEFNLKNPDTVIKDLENIAKKGKIADLGGFGEKSEKDILRAISEFRKGAGKANRMPLPYAGELADKILIYLKKSDSVIDAVPLGSLRRMLSTIGDIDVAVASDKPKEVINYFVAYPYKDRIIEKGTATASILVSGGKQVDLMVQSPKSFGSLLQHFTGSKNHNVSLREHALDQGLSLSEYGIKQNKKLLNFDTEEKFYKALKMAWIPPEIREDIGEIELAIANKLPKLVKLSDVKGDVHIHSNYPIEPSHDLGRSSMEEIVEKAKSLNYEYVGFSEHNPSISKHTKKNIDKIIKKRNEKIEQIKESNKNIRIINLLEVDIMPNGDLALDKSFLDYLDGVIVSVHSSLNMSKKDMTKRVLTGLSHKKARILGHPTGRKINERAGYDLNWEEVFEFCKKNNNALEINAWPNRLDLPDSLVREAVKNKVKMIINSDSHEVKQMNLIKYGVAVARRGWAEKDDIVNTLPYNKFIKWLKAT